MLIPALEVGGTHVSAGLVESETWTLIGSPLRTPLDAQAIAPELLTTFAAAANELGAPAGAVWGVGMPDPFDYDGGIGHFHSVGKFEALSGVDVRTALLERFQPPATDVRFVNDAESFLLGEWITWGAPADQSWAAVTLGTGVGSGSLVDGHLVRTGGHLPPGGRAHRLTVNGAPLEEVMSRRALMRSYAAASGPGGTDVREICARARAGDPVASRVLNDALGALGEALAPWLADFDVVVMGGSMTQSWDVLGPPFEGALRGRAVCPQLLVAADVERCALIGAARYAFDP
jgi:glucokinase